MVRPSRALVPMVLVCLVAAPAAAGPRLLVNASASTFPDVVLSVHATTKDGKPITTLSRESFTVFEDLAKGEVTNVQQLTTGTKKPLDVVFVFDTTGSMQDELNGLIRRAQRFTDLLGQSGLDFRLSMLGFSDEVGRGTTPTDDVNAFKKTLSSIRAGGGGDEPENQLDALVAASELAGRTEARRVFVLVTDAPFHAHDLVSDRTADQVVEALRRAKVELHVVGPELDEYRWMSRSLGGGFFDKDSGEFEQLVQSLAGELAANYLVTYRSPRPVADGTRRSVTLTAKDASGMGEDASQYVAPALVAASSRKDGMQSDKSAFAPHFAIDGRPETAWVSDGTASVEWLELTFEAPRTLGSITVRPSQDKRYAVPTTLRLGLGGAERLVTLDGSRKEQTLSFEPVTTGVLRVWVAKSAPGGVPVGISELSVAEGETLVPELARLRVAESAAAEAEELNRLGEQAYHSKRLAESVKLYQSALAKAPEHAQCWSNLGLSFWKLKRYAESIAANRQAIRLASRQGLNQVVANSAYSMGRTFEEQGQLKQALQSFWWANQAVPKDVYRNAIDRLNRKIAEE